MKIPERWKRPFRLALVIVALVILTMANKYYVQFQLNFSFGSQPVTTETPAEKALEISYLEDLAFGHRDKFTQSLYVRSIQSIYPAETDNRTN